MALNYHLIIQNNENEINLEQLQKSLESSFEVKTTPSFLIRDELTIYISKNNDEYIKSLFGNPYPDISVAFRVRNGKYEVGVITMLKIVTWLMSYLKKQDMVLLFNNEDVILQRISGSLVLNNEDPEFWDQEKKFIFSNLSYQFAKIPPL